MSKERPSYNFANFKNRIKTGRTPITTRAYNRWGYHGTDPVREDFSLDEIQEIIRSGDIDSLRELSRYFYRTNSMYRNNIDFLACLPTYDTVVIPVYQEGKGSKAQIIKAFYNACEFVDRMDIPNTFCRITKQWLKNGIYYGVLRTEGDKVTIQDLPLTYCRTRFKDFNNLNILQFNLNYFFTINDEEMRKESIATFPEQVQKAWRLFISKGKKYDPWVLLPAASGGISFSFTNDQTPLLIASLPALKKLDDAVSREQTRDKNELRKLLIQRMPIDNDGQLVFQLDQVADIHASVAQMLADEDTVDVLTTFGETNLESLQDSSAATQSTNRIEKYKANAWDALGRGLIMFNPDGSSALAYAIKKDQALMSSYLNIYQTWIKFQINERFGKTNLSFDFEFLPLTVFNKKDLQSSYFQGAQYGYSKMFAGVALGIKQMNQLSLMNFENEFLEMSTKMIPLQSSYTTSGNVVADQQKKEKSEENTKETSKAKDITNKGGRPALSDQEKSEKTQANIESAG